jgi:predicted metal-dependent TIM-barrel fold hydrolase
VSGSQHIFIDYFATQCLIGWRHCVVVKVHVAVGFGPQANPPGNGLYIAKLPELLRKS